MFETAIGYILNKVLGEYIEGLDMDNLNIGMLSTLKIVNYLLIMILNLHF